MKKISLIRMIGWIVVACHCSLVSAMALQATPWMAAFIGVGITCGIELMITGAISELAQAKEQKGDEES